MTASCSKKRLSLGKSGGSCRIRGNSDAFWTSTLQHRLGTARLRRILDHFGAVGAVGVDHPGCGGGSDSGSPQWVPHGGAAFGRPSGVKRERVVVRFFERALRLRLDQGRVMAATKTGKPVGLLREFCGRVLSSPQRRARRSGCEAEDGARQSRRVPESPQRRRDRAWQQATGSCSKSKGPMGALRRAAAGVSGCERDPLTRPPFPV